MGMYDGLARVKINFHVYFSPDNLPQVLVDCPCRICHSGARIEVNYSVHSMTTTVAFVEVHYLNGLCVSLA